MNQIMGFLVVYGLIRECSYYYIYKTISELVLTQNYVVRFMVNKALSRNIESRE